MNPKWHYKIKNFNVKTVVKNSSGPQKNKSSIKKKVLTRLCVAKIVEQKLAQISTMDKEEEIGDLDNLSQ